MKKLFFALILISVFISILCISTSAVDYGTQYLDPDYYEDDIGLVILLEYDYDDFVDQHHIVIPLYQVRIPDSLSDEYYIFIKGINWSSDYVDFGEYLEEVILDMSFYRDSQLENGNDQSIDLSNVELINLDSYPILSSWWDDPQFKFYINGIFQTTISSSEFPYTYPDMSGNNGILFLSIDCNIWTGEAPTYGLIPTYPPRPLPPDPPPSTDIPLTPGNINNFLTTLFRSPISTFTKVLEATNTLYAFLGVFVFVMFVKFVVNPVIGSSLGSDSVKSKKPKVKGDKSND